jgi:hypothetical protein
MPASRAEWAEGSCSLISISFGDGTDLHQVLVADPKSQSDGNGKASAAEMVNIVS